jgi:hypothetical protein
MRARTLDRGGESEPQEFETLDEAIGAALAQITAGGVVAIHDEDCKHDGEDESSCTCTPLELTKGAEA